MEKKKKSILRTGFEPVTYGYLYHYSPPLYQLSYRRVHTNAANFYKFYTKLPYIILLKIICSLFRRQGLCLFKKCLQETILYNAKS